MKEEQKAEKNNVSLKCRRIAAEDHDLIQNEGGKTLGVAKDSKVELIYKDGYAFKDFLGTGELVPYEDWRLSYEERAADLAGRLPIEDIAGLMLYSNHQLIPAKGPRAAIFGGTYGGKRYEESGAKPWDLTDQQKTFITRDRIRHVLILGLENTETAVRWNNKVQALAEGEGFGIPLNNCSDPRHGAGTEAEYMAITGEPISKWANGIGFTATFDPALVQEFGEAASAEYRALGITTALSPQIDLATEPRWMRLADTFGEHTQLTVEMTKAYCDGFQTTKDSPDGWGMDSVNAMVKHFPGGGPVEAGRDARYAYGKYAVYPGHNFEEHLKPFSQGAFRLNGKTEKASAVMPYYTVSTGVDQKYGENVGNSYNKYLITDLLREELGYDGVVCTDWSITHDTGATEEEFAGKCWGVENLSEAERHLKALEAGVDQFGGNSDAAPLLEAYALYQEKYGKEAAAERFRRSAYRLLLNIFRTGLFENPYLDLATSEATVGRADFVEKGYRSQLRSVTMIKNKEKALPLQKGIRLYVPDRFVKSHLDFMSHPTKDRQITPAGKKVLGQQFTLVDTPREADAAICYMESPISVGYDPADREKGGNGYVPITLQYRPYQAVSARTHSLAGGDPLEDFTDRSYKDKWNSAANESDLDNLIETKKCMGDKPVIAVISLHNPMVMAELEPYADAILLEYGVSPQAVSDVLTGDFVPEGLLPVQLPADMDTVEEQCEDVAFDMECYRDSQGNVYDFGFGLNFDGVIRDERTDRYTR